MNQPGCDDEFYVPPISQEFQGAPLGDRRRQARLLKVVEGLAPAPRKSLPQTAATKRELDGLYRFLSNKAVKPQSVLQPHIEQTAKRCEAFGRVVVAHDTTECEYDGKVRREGLGYLRSRKTQGFLAHISLAVRGDTSHLPLGVLALHTWTRQTLRPKKTGGRKLSGGDYAKITDKESKRWAEQVDKTHQVLGERATPIHVMDREADAFELLRELLAKGRHFVIRVSKPRNARADEQSTTEPIQTLAARAQGIFETQVPISERAPSSTPQLNKTFPARESRQAKLVFSASRVQLKRPRYLEGELWLTLNVVHVHEIDAPQGVEPVEWFLYTSEPVDTPQDVVQVVEDYRGRWPIEEFNKALKTGCSLEERQLESYRALLNALCIFIPMAWQMLLLRTLARTSPNARAETVLTLSQIEVLRELGTQKVPPNPNVSQVLIAVAILGGYVPNKRGPGWLTLGRGLEKLLLLERGWTGARDRMRRDAG